MVNGTSSAMGLNEVGTTLARNRGFTLSRHFSVTRRALVELIGDTASELWDVGAYDIGFGTPKLTQDEDGPHLVAAYNGRLPHGKHGTDGNAEARKLLAASLARR